MNKLLLTLSILISLICFSSQSWALPNCSSSPPFDNCYGSHTFPNGNTYVGEWQNNKYNGQGTFIFKSGEKYEGEFKNDKRHGQGTNTYKSGQKYVGEYKNGKSHGQGTYNYADGTKDVGEFQNGKLNGFAIRYDKYGTILKQGIWKDDKFLYSQNKSTSSNSNSKLDKYKSFCEEIGFVKGTEKFGNCVLEAMKKG